MHRTYEGIKRTASRRSDRASERGASAVEFALVVPVFLIFVFGIIEYGTIFLVRNQMTEAVSDAARTAVNYSTTAQALSESLSALQTNLPHDGAGLMSSNCSSSSSGPVQCSSSLTSNCNAPAGYKCLQVSVTYDYSADPVVSFPLLPAPSKLTASTTVLIADPTGQ